MTDRSDTRFAAAVIVAAGRGERFGQGNKVLSEAAGRPLLAWSLDVLAASMTVRDVVIVAGEHTIGAIRTLVRDGAWSHVTAIVLGGSTRQESVARGLEAVAADLAVVLVHDAARPLAEADQFDAAASAALVSGAAIVATPVADTLKRVADGVIVETVSRAHLWAAQTPQAFRLDDYREILGMSSVSGVEFTDDASIFEAHDRPVSVVAGSRLNIKVTHPEDLELVDALLRARLTARGRVAKTGGGLTAGPAEKGT